MKKIYICIAMGVFFASCSTEEGTKESIQNLRTVDVDTQANWNSIMTKIENTCVQQSYNDTEEMIAYVKSVAFANEDFKNLNFKNYTSPTAAEVEYLLTVNPANALSAMSYSAATNYYLNQMLVVNGPWATNPASDANVSQRDKQLLGFLSNTWGPDKDWDWDKMKPLAFVKGYENSVAKAIILSVAVKQAEKIEKVN
ncbi:MULTISPECIES: hypothetical protein [Myroides]|uniref:hypothetical protein n=1 Tax=Myroides odoratus TaxID=256 RepID=UPI0024C02086|nr:hypothetical protein [Myroides sp. mNGS23_01]WHT40673.1 hypothetical protein QNH98_09130 [Myroides sp. mNGS23_01]